MFNNVTDIVRVDMASTIKMAARFLVQQPAFRYTLIELKRLDELYIIFTSLTVVKEKVEKQKREFLYMCTRGIV